MLFRSQPWMRPLTEKCDELVGTHVADDLIKAGVIRCEPVNYLRGSTFKDSVVIVDESQNLELEELVTILTRVGDNSKIFLLGDAFQSDIKRGYFSRVRDEFADIYSDEKGIRVVNYDATDVRRHPILTFIVEKLGRLKHP